MWARRMKTFEKSERQAPYELEFLLQRRSTVLFEGLDVPVQLGIRSSEQGRSL